MFKRIKKIIETKQRISKMVAADHTSIDFSAESISYKDSAFVSVCRLKQTSTGFLVDILMQQDYQEEIRYKLFRDGSAVTDELSSNEKQFAFTCQQPLAPGQYLAYAVCMDADMNPIKMWSNKIEIYQDVYVHQVSGILAKSIVYGLKHRLDCCFFVDDKNATKSMYLLDLRDVLAEPSTRNDAFQYPQSAVTCAISAIPNEDECTVILFRSGFAREYIDEEGLYTSFPHDQRKVIDQANATLDIMYEEASRLRPDAKLIDISRFCFAKTYCDDPLAQLPCDAFVEVAIQSVFVSMYDSELCPVDKNMVQKSLCAPSPQEKLAFWMANEPFMDFALFITQASKADNHLRLSRMRLRLAEYGFAVIELKKFEPHICYAIVPQSRLLADGSLPPLFSGYGILGKKFIMGGNEYSKHRFSATDHEEGSGRYSYLRSGRKSITLGTDWNGAEIIFYFDGITMESESPGDKNAFSAWSVFSNRYHLTLLSMAAWGVPLALDSDRILLNLFREYVFAEQILPPNMPVKGIKMLPLTHKVVVDSNSISLCKIWDPLKKTVYTEKEYYRLIMEAAHDMAKQCKILLNCKKFPQIYADISGGLDTRMVLSTLSGVKGYSNKVYARTFSVPNSKDIEIGIEVARTLGLRYHADSTVPPLHYVDRETSTRMYRSYFMGAMNKTLDAHYSALGMRSAGYSAMLEITGMFGETYRQFSYDMWNPYNPPTQIQAASTWVGYVKNYSPTLSSLDLFSAMDRILADQEGNIYEKNANIYIGGRMRTIHGQYAPIVQERNVVMHIGSKKLFCAARMLPYVQWGRGDAQMDIIMLLNPKLAFLQVDGKPYLNKAIQERYPEMHKEYKTLSDSREVTITSDIGYQSAREKEFANIAAAKTATHEESSTWTWEDEICRLYHKLIALDKRFFDVLCPGLMEKLIQITSNTTELKYDTPASFSAKIYAKLSSYSDQIELSTNTVFTELS